MIRNLMARYLSNAKLLSPDSLADVISLAINRGARGYAAASRSQGGVHAAACGGGKGEITDGVVHTVVEEKDVISKESGPTTIIWGPDPVTGYYRPSDRVVGMDSVDQRDMTLNHKENKQSN